ncbi:MAG: 3',5'-cyclic-AMP phosphodiesterase [Cyanobacteria bacterium P01_A01_bin.17]
MSLSSPLLVAQLSDLHLFSTPEQTLLGLQTMASFAAILDALRQLPQQPDVILLTGDLAQDESSAAYEQIAQQIAPLNIPTYWLPGNHDHLPSMASILSQPPIYPDKAFQMGGWQFLMLDSTVAQQVHGKFSAQHLEQLEQQLQANTNPTLIALHHPPVTIDSAWLDNLGLRNSEAFFAVLERYDHVKLAIFGHIHQQVEQHRRGIAYLSTPSTCVQFAPHQKTFALDETRPGFRLLQLYPDGTFESEVQRVQIDLPQLDVAAKGY